MVVCWSVSFFSFTLLKAKFNVDLTLVIMYRWLGVWSWDIIISFGPLFNYMHICLPIHNPVRTWLRFCLLEVCGVKACCVSVNPVAIAYPNAYYGRGSGPYHLDNVCRQLTGEPDPSKSLLLIWICHSIKEFCMYSSLVELLWNSFNVCIIERSTVVCKWCLLSLL